MSKKVLLIDAFSLAFRAFYSYPTSLRLTDGTPSNAVYGFLAMIFKAIDDLKPTHVCICFDRKEPTFRHEMYDSYKANRTAPPEEFAVQVPHFFEVVKRCGLAHYDKSGYEADDIIGTLSHNYSQEKTQCLIMTGDHDALQLVDEYVTVVMNQRGVSDLKFYTPGAVEEKYGFGPDLIVDFKALKGDSSDNIPGVKGVGDKTATKLLQDYKSLEGIYDHLDEISSKSLKQKLIDSKKDAYMSHKLATIFTDVPLSIDDDYIQFTPQWSEIMAVFKEYQLTTLVKKYSEMELQQSVGDGLFDGASDVESDSETDDVDYVLIDSVDALKAILPNFTEGFAIDLETTSLSIRDAQIVGVSLSAAEGQAYYIACNKYLENVNQDQTVSLFSDGASVHCEFKLNPLLKELKPLLEEESVLKVAHNAKYETGVLANYGIQLKGVEFDTMLAAFVTFPGDKVGLKDVALRHLGVEMTEYEALTGKGKSQIPFKDVPIEDATQYACADADMTWRLYRYFKPKIAEKEVMSLYYDIEIPCMKVLAEMEHVGICLDTGYLQSLSDTFSVEIESLRAKIQELAGKSFNVNSTKQLAEVLFDDMGLPVIKKTKTGRSTDSSVLEALAEKHEIAKLLIRFRTLEKLQSTYVTALPHSVSTTTNRVHTSFNQTVAITGRLSSTSPNLQNIPIRSEEGRLIRQAFVPSAPDRKLLSIDYSQIELRVMAHLSQDENLIEAFKNGEDIHARTAAIVNGISLEEVTKEQRYSAKAVNFGILYGQSSFGLSGQLGIDRKSAKEIIEDYFEKLPKVKAFIDSTIASAKEEGQVRTEFGRFRLLPDIHSKVFHLRQFAERAAVNTRVQGTAADIMKLAMIDVQRRITESGLVSDMVLQVHDELLFDMVVSEEDDLVSLVKKAMGGVVSWDVPLGVDVAVGDHWGEID
jgi:DNA polymerase-1